MTHSAHVRASIAPLGDAGPPTASVIGDVPVVEFTTWPTTFEIHLGNHDAPDQWLRETAAVLIGLANELAPAPVSA